MMTEDVEHLSHGNIYCQTKKYLYLSNMLKITTLERGNIPKQNRSFFHLVQITT